MKASFFIAFFIAFVLTVNGLAEAERYRSSVSIEKQDVKIIVDKQGNYEETITVHMKAHDDNARVKLSAFQIMYNGKYEDTQITAGGVIHEGKEETLNVASIKKTTLPIGHVPGISELNMITIPYSGVSTGDTIWFTKKTKSKLGQISGEYHQTFPFGVGYFEKNTNIRLQSDLPLQMTVNDSGSFLDISEQKTKLPYVYEVKLKRPVLAIEEAAIAASDIMQLRQRVPRVDFNSAINWSSINKHNNSFYSLSDVELNSPEFKSFVSRIVVKSATQDQVEEILMQLEKSITYSARWYNEDSGFRPRPLNEILKTRAGDCKDYAKLFLAAAKVLNVQSEPVYTRLSTPLNFIEYLSRPMNPEKPNPSSSYFNHVVVRYKNKTDWITIDPGRRIADASRTPYFLNNAWSLNLNEDTPAYRLKIAAKDYSNLKIKNKFAKFVDGSLKAQTEVLAQGEFANFLRSTYFDNGDKAFTKMVEMFLPTKNNINVTVFKPEITRRPGDLKLSVKYSVPDDAQKDPNGLALTFPQYFGLKNQEDTSYRSYLSSYSFTLLQMPHTASQETTIEFYFTPDELKKDCFVVGPMADVQRTVSNLKSSIEIKDVVTFKSIDMEHFSQEALTPLIHNAQDLDRCSKDAQIKLEDKQFQKSFEENIDLSKPYANKSVEDHSHATNLRRLRELNYRISKNKKDVGLLIDRANLYADMTSMDGSYKQDAHFEHAVADLLEAQRLEPLNPSLYGQIGSYYLKLKNYTAARKQFDDGYKISSKDIWVLNLGGQILAHKNKFSDAEKYFLAALRQKGPNELKNKVLNTLAAFYCEQMNSCSKSLPLHEQIIALNPKDAWNYHNAAIAHKISKSYTKALLLSRQALGLKEFSAAKKELQSILVLEATHLISTMERTEKLLTQAEKNLIEAYKIDRTNIPTLVGIANFYFMRSYLYKNTADITTAQNYINEIKAIDETQFKIERFNAGELEQLIRSGIENRHRETASDTKLSFEETKQFADSAMNDDATKGYAKMVSSVANIKIEKAAFLCGVDIPAEKSISVVLSINHKGTVIEVAAPENTPKLRCIRDMLLTTGIPVSPPTSPFYVFGQKTISSDSKSAL